MITLYTINCPKCKVLEKKLDAAGIQYEKVEDTDVMMSLGIKSAPVLSVDGNLMLFQDAVKWINAGGI